MNLDTKTQFIIIIVLIVIILTLIIMLIMTKERLKQTLEDPSFIHIDDLENTLHRNIYFETFTGEIAWNVTCQPTTDKDGYINGTNAFIRRKDTKTGNFKRVRVIMKLIGDKALILPKK